MAAERPFHLTAALTGRGAAWWLLIAGLMALACGLLPASARTSAAGTCGYESLPLGEAARRAQAVVVADVGTESTEPDGSLSAQLRVRGMLLGRAPGTALTLRDPGPDCATGPRLLSGVRFLLFLGQDGAGWSLVGGEGGLYRLSGDGVYFPPDRAGGEPQQLPVPPAELVRDVTIVSGENPARGEALIAALGLPETLPRSGSGRRAPELLARLTGGDALLTLMAAAGLLALCFCLLRLQAALPDRRRLQ